MSTLLPDIDGASATRFEMLLRASRSGDAVMVAAMLTAIPVVDLLAIELRLGTFGIDLKSLIRAPSGPRQSAAPGYRPPGGVPSASAPSTPAPARTPRRDKP